MKMKCLLLTVLALFAVVNAGKDCPRPSLVDGEVTGTSTGEMFVGKFECNPGFHLVGNSVVKCRHGIWTNQIPVCVKIGTCPPLPSIPNGAAILVKGSRGSMYRIKCRAGFLRLGARRIHCSGRQWSSEMPVCAKATCDESGMDSIQGGYAAKIMGGAMYRYQCIEGVEMTGSPTLYCDSLSWNGTAPTCSGAPGPVKVQTWVDGLETSQVKLGDFVTVTCSSTGGFPSPKITIFKNFELVADSDAMRKPYFTFAATVSDNNADIACFANNNPENQPTEDHTSLTVSFPPKKVMVGGLTQLKRQNVYNFICRSESASPPPTLVWSAINFRGETKEVEIVSEDSIDVGEGWEAVSSIQLQTTEDERDISITCRAGNTEGRVSHTINIKTQYLPETVSLTGPSTMSHDEESMFTCSSFASHPTPSLLWKLVKVKGEEEEEELVEGDVVKEETEEGGVSVKSILKVTNVGRDVDSLVVKCLARVNGMEDVQSESHKVEITVESVEEPTQELEVVQHVEAAAIDPEMNVEEDNTIDSSPKDVNEENLQNELKNTVESDDHQQTDDKMENGENKDKNTSLEQEQKFENTKEEIVNEIEVTEKSLDYEENKETDALIQRWISHHTTDKTRQIEAPNTVTEGYYKLYDENNDEEDDDYEEAIRPQQEVPVEVANQKTSKSLNAEIHPQSLIQSNSSPVFDLSLLIMLFSTILAFGFGNLTCRRLL